MLTTTEFYKNALRC